MKGEDRSPCFVLVSYLVKTRGFLWIFQLLTIAFALVTPLVSGEPPKVPVVSKKSGLVYEQRLIHKYINENGKDPVTGDTLELDDLIELKSSKFLLLSNHSA